MDGWVDDDANVHMSVDIGDQHFEQVYDPTKQSEMRKMKGAVETLQNKMHETLDNVLTELLVVDGLCV